MKTATLNMTNARWGRILGELGVTSIAPLVNSRDPIEPGNGPIAMLETGAKLYWSDSRGEATISGYAYDGSDVDPYLY